MSVRECHRLIVTLGIWVLAGWGLMGAPSPTSASTPRFEHLSIDKGLSQSVVNCILQDQTGFMWFGTQDGLNHYDGYGFKVYKYDPQTRASLSDNHIRSLCQGADGLIWIGTDAGGLNRYDPRRKQFTRFRHDPANPASIANNRILAVCVDRRGMVWAGTDGGGLDNLDPLQDAFFHHRHDPADRFSISNDRVTTLVQAPDGTLWVGTEDGLNHLDPLTGRFTRYLHDPSHPSGLSDNRIRALAFDQKGRLWIGTDGGGLNRLDPDTGAFTRFRHHPENPTNNLVSDRIISLYIPDRPNDDVVWVGTADQGLIRLDPESGATVTCPADPNKPFSLSHGEVRAVREDASGVLWVGTFQGLNKYDRSREAFSSWTSDPRTPDSLSNGIIWAVCEPSNQVGRSLWIGTWGGGLNHLDRRTGRFTVYRHNPTDARSLTSDKVWRILDNDDGTLWVGTYGGGLDRFRIADGTCRHYRHQPQQPGSLSHNDISSLFRDRSGTLWIGTFGGGLNRFDPATGTFRSWRHREEEGGTLSQDEVMAITEGPPGVLWIGTYGGGLNRFDVSTGRFSAFRNDPGRPGSLSHDRVMTLFRDSRDRLWVGTDGGGLNLFDPTRGTFRYFTEKDGLPNNTIYGILEDQSGNLWLSTNKGLSCFNPDRRTFRNLDVRDGLQSNEFNQNACFRSPSGEMFFGGISGLNAFFPDKVRKNPFVPPVVLTSFRVFDREVPFDRALSTVREVRLASDETFISFEFAALDYRAPEKNRYTYIMEGFDRDWIDCGTRRYASYTNLSPGDYTFRVRGSNNDGVWNQSGVALHIIVPPPFWYTWWFRSLSLLMVLLLAAVAYRWRIHNIQMQKRNLELQVAQRTLELQEKNTTLLDVQQQLELAAHTDPLTGLSNRRDMVEKLHRELDRHRRSARPFALVIADIDNFKAFNDRFGHDCGDHVLVTVSGLMRTRVRNQDTVARWGGEEFLFLLPETDLEGGWVTAEKLRSAVARHSFEFNGHHFSVTMTLGVSCLQGAVNLDTALKLADDALYRGKQSGKNRVEKAVHTPDIG